MTKKNLALFLSLFFLSASGCATAQTSKAKTDAAELTQAWHIMVGEGEQIKPRQPSYFNWEIDLKPEDSVSYNKRGIAYFAQAQYQKALDDFNKAIELDPEYADPYFFRGFYYHTMDAYEKAVDDYNRARKLNPKNDIAKIMLNKIVKKTANIASGDDETDDDKVACRWTKPLPFTKRVACKTKKEWARLEKNSIGAGQAVSSFPPNEGVAHTSKEVIDNYGLYSH